jgi:hypothetical protein
MYEFATEDNQRYDTWDCFSGIFRIVNTDLSWAGCTSLPRKTIRGTTPGPVFAEYSVLLIRI